MKEFLRANGVEYIERDVSRDPAAAQEMVRLSRQRGVPVIDVDGQPVVGFNQPLLRQLLAARAARAGGLGLRVKETPEGILIGGVREASRGARAGLRPGDVIEEIDGAPARTIRALEGRPAPLRLVVRRGSERLQLTV